LAHSKGHEGLHRGIPENWQAVMRWLTSSGNSRCKAHRAYSLSGRAGC